MPEQTSGFGAFTYSSGPRGPLLLFALQVVHTSSTEGGIDRDGRDCSPALFLCLLVHPTYRVITFCLAARISDLFCGRMAPLNPESVAGCFDIRSSRPIQPTNRCPPFVLFLFIPATGARALFHCSGQGARRGREGWDLFGSSNTCTEFQAIPRGHAYVSAYVFWIVIHRSALPTDPISPVLPTSYRIHGIRYSRRLHSRIR